jgi:hypothetical protein
VAWLRYTGFNPASVSWLIMPVQLSLKRTPESLERLVEGVIAGMYVLGCS